MKLEKTIEAIQNATQELERLARLKNIDAPRGETAAHLHAQKTLRKASEVAKDVIRSRGSQSYKMKFDTLKNINSLINSHFKHSSTGGVRPQRELFTYSQLAVFPSKGGRRFHEIFSGERRDDLSNVRILQPTLSASNNAARVAEGQPKPVRQWTLSETIVSVNKIAVTDVVTEEFILAAPNEELLDFLILAHTQNVLDILDLTIQNELSSLTSFLFGPANFTNVLNPNPSGLQSGIRWHDLLAAIAMFFKHSLEDNVANIEFPDTWLLPTRQRPDVYYAVMQDREPDAAYLHKNHDVERWYNSLTPDSFWPCTINRITAFARDTFRLDIHDAVILTFDRIVEENQERNLFRITAEIYFWFYSLYTPAKSVEANPIDIANIS